MKPSHQPDRRRASLPAILLVLALVLAPFGLAPGHASATGSNYYVNSASGNDGNSGTSSSSPWKTLAPVNGRSFGAGDVINLARGSSWTGGGGNTATLTINGSGASGSPITLQPYGSGAAPLLRNPSTGYSQGVLVKGSWVVVQGLLVREAREAGIKLQAGADHVVVQDNEVTASGAGVQTDSQYNLITRNYLHDLTMVVNTPGGDDDYGASGVLVKGPNNEVSYNRIVNCKAPSSDYGSDGSAVEFYNTVDNSSIHHNYSLNALSFNEIGGGSARNVKIAYNLIVGSSPVEVIHASDGFASVVSNLQFANNTIVNTAGSYSAFWIGGSLSGASALVMRNNIFYGAYQILMDSSSAFTHDHNLFNLTGGGRLNFNLGTGERQVDPLFANLGGADYQLQSASPAINTGASPLLYGTDYDGCAVPSGAGPDIGAYEYGGAAAQPTPTAPAPTATATQPPASGPAMIDNMEGYASDAAIQGAWPVANGTQISLARSTVNKLSGSYGMSYAYTMGTNNYGGVNHPFNTAANWSGQAGLAFYLKPDGSGRSLHVQFMEAAGEYWEKSLVLSGTAATTVYLPFSGFAHPSWYGGGTEANGVVDLGAIGQIAIFVNQDGTPTGSGTIYLDDIQARSGALSSPTPTPAPTQPAPTQPPAPTATAAPTQPPAPTATPAPSNLIDNGSFESNQSQWTLKLTDPAAGRLSRDNHAACDGRSSAKVAISKSSTDWHLQLRQDNLTLVAGRQYTVSFCARASANRSIGFVVQQMNDPYTPYSEQSASLNDAWQTFSYTFAPGQDDSVFLGFNLAGDTGTVWIDGVSLK